MNQTLAALLSNTEVRRKEYVITSLNEEFSVGAAWWGRALTK